MKRNFPTEFLYQVFALIIAVIVVHAVYVTVVRPRATEVMAEQALRIQEEENYTAERSVWVLIRDFEQESCFILMLWAFSIMGFKAAKSLSERSLLQRELGRTEVPEPDAMHEVLRTGSPWSMPQIVHAVDLGLGVAGHEGVRLDFDGVSEEDADGLEQLFRS